MRHNHDSTIGPWFRRNPLATLVVAVALFGGVSVSRFLIGEAEDASALLYTLPVALVAFAFGRRAGVVSGAAGTVLLITWAVAEDSSLAAIGWASRIVPLALIGV